MNAKTLLIELGTEELPPKSLKTLANAFVTSLYESLQSAQLISQTASDTLPLLAAPRRLAFICNDVLAVQPDQEVERKGPSVKAAFHDDGSPTPALLGFAKSCDTDIDNLERRQTEKGEWLFFKQTKPGNTITDIVQTALENAIKALPIAKRMRWGNKDIEFVRPVHWLVVMHGNTVLPIHVLGLDAKNQTSGHRFHSSGSLTIDHADHYENLLLDQGKVLVNYSNRQQVIQQQVDALAQQVNGKAIYSSDAFLDEVTSLVEYPNAILGAIDERFMSVPQESLISSMRDHQKYFHVVDTENQLLPHFITVSNIDSSDSSRVRSGNERVLRARLADAEFFWETDKKAKLEDNLDKLKNVLYHAKLGDMDLKVNRIESLAANIARLINADPQMSARAAKLAKADLTSNMVGEFSDLQGIMGKYYAQHDGENTIVAEAIEQHYWPKSADARLPESREAQAVALADKLDSLVGIYGIGEIPTGDKDPYALRRAALGIINILTANQHDLSLDALITMTADEYYKQDIVLSDDDKRAIAHFMQGRYKPYYQSKQYKTALINAVAASGLDKPVDFAARIAAMNTFESYPEANDLAAANKRIKNILKKAETDQLPDSIDKQLLDSEAEVSLVNAIDTVANQAKQDFDSGQYESGLQKLATLRDPIDAFFDSVMVMADDIKVKMNRLRILQELNQLFSKVADLSLL